MGTVGGAPNTPIPNTESLQVSNFVTTDTLPAASPFGAANADPDNFRLQVVDPTVVGPSVQVRLDKVLAGVPFNRVMYTLAKKQGAQFRGEYLRVVSDSIDDAAPGAGDPGHQSLFALPDEAIRITYTPAAGAPIVQTLPICRPSDESDNGANKRLHDLRTIHLAFKGFVGALPHEPFQDINFSGPPPGVGERHLDVVGAGGTAGFDITMSVAQMASYEAMLMENFNARLAQACVRGQSTSNYTVPLPAGVNLLNGIDLFNEVENPAGPFDLSMELSTLLAAAGVRSAVNSDGNLTNDVLDVLFVYELRPGVVAGIGAVVAAAALPDVLFTARVIATPIANFHGTILYGAELAGRFASHYTLAHESCHIVLNQFDIAANLPNAAQRPGAALVPDMLFPELGVNPFANAVANSGKRLSYQIPGHPGQVQTYRSSMAFVRD